MAKENLQRTCATRGKPFDQNHVWENMPMATHPGKDVPVGKLGKNQPVSLAENIWNQFQSVKFFVSRTAKSQLGLGYQLLILMAKKGY